MSETGGRAPADGDGAQSGSRGDPPTPWLEGALRALGAERVERVDVGFEGRWSETVRTLWTRRDGWVLDEPYPPGEVSPLRPAIELMLADGWIGLHCGRARPGGYVVDLTVARRVVRMIEAARRPGP